MAIQFATIKTNLFGDRKVRRLYQLIEERDAMAAIGFWLEAVLDSWGDEEPKRVHAPDDLLAALQEVGLADAEGRIPSEHLAKAMSRINKQRDAWREAKRRQRGSTNVQQDTMGTDGVSLDPVRTSSLVSSREGESEGKGKPQPDGLNDVLGWFYQHDLDVPFYESAYLKLSAKVRAIGSEEVINRLAAIRDSGTVDPDDLWGYVFALDREGRRNRPLTDDEEVEAAIKRTRAQNAK